MRHEQSKQLLLVDGHSILNRAFYGMPNLTNAAGVPTGAVYGFLSILFHHIDMEKPTHLTVAFDEHAPTFRHKMYDAYKGTRHAMPDELKAQVPMMRQLLTAMGIPVISQPGLEADDLLGTMARIAEEDGYEVAILSGDHDLLQLATDHTKILIPTTRAGKTTTEVYYAKDVIEREGVTPQEFIDVKALMGDTSDNIPGVPKIGKTTAPKIIAQFHSIEEAYAHADEVKPPLASKNLVAYYDQAVLSKKLATIEVHADITYDVASAQIGDFYTQEAYALCKEWEFRNLLGRFEEKTIATENSIEESFVLDAEASAVNAFVETMQKEQADTLGFFFLQDTTGSYGAAVSDGKSALYLPVVTIEELTSLVKKAVDAGMIVSTFGLKDVLKTFALKQVGQFLTPENTHDVEVAEYLLQPLKTSYAPDALAMSYLRLVMPEYKDLFGKKTLAQAHEEDVKELGRYACYCAYVAASIRIMQMEALSEKGEADLYKTMELPLIFTLSDMELCGIAADKDALHAYGEKLTTRIDALESSIYAQAGETFNINSPKQLGEILFGKMQLPGGKKTKTGYSTAADVLEKMAPSVPMVADILEYRQLTKLRSTYAEGLEDCIASDGRIHTTFQQTVTATGRISSTEPNLQNIPIRMELGKQVRKVFHPREGYVFVDADYSQIELRVLAHMSGDENLIRAFCEGQDIHRATASLVFHAPFEEVTELQRRNAKAVNFGIVYGISAHGLAEDLQIGRAEASKYIEDYFLAYPQMKTFLDGLVEEAKEKGAVRTMYGRVRPIPEIRDSHFATRQFGERVAMNSPIQGTAADIIKIAMVRVHDRLSAEGLASRLLLQVHDELLIEAKQEELPQVRKILSEEMEQAAKLSVPLTVDMHEGMTWYDAK